MGVERVRGSRLRGRRRAALAIALAAFAVFTPLLAGTPDDLSAADAAFDAGETARALGLYEQVLIREPRAVPALVRSAQILSWDGKFAEAIRRYDLAIAAEPQNRFARLERAKVQSWAGRYDAAIDGFRGLLDRSSSRREARLGLARSLSWSGRQAEARKEYQEVLLEDADDADALLGVAQTWAWSGDARRARPAYERALAASPGSKDAQVGLGWIDLQDGDPYGASARVEALARTNPDDKDVAALRAAARRARAPWVLWSYDRIDDRDGVSANIGKLEGGLGLPRMLDLRAGIARWDLSSPISSEGTIDGVWGVVGWTPGRGHRLEVRAGVDRGEDSAGTTETSVVGGLSYRYPIAGSWNGGVAWDRDTYRYSPAIVDDRIAFDAFAANVEGRIGGRWRVAAAAGAWDLSDGNGRKSLNAGAWITFKPAPVSLETGYQFRGLDFDRDTKADGVTPTSYFSPDGLTAHALQARARRPLGNRDRGYWNVGGEAGVQSFARNGVETSNDVFFGADALIGVPLGSAVVLEGFGSYSSYAQQGGGNWRYRQFGLRLRWTVGG